MSWLSTACSEHNTICNHTYTIKGKWKRSLCDHTHSRPFSSFFMLLEIRCYSHCCWSTFYTTSRICFIAYTHMAEKVNDDQIAITLVASAHKLNFHSWKAQFAMILWGNKLMDCVLLTLLETDRTNSSSDSCSHPCLRLCCYMLHPTNLRMRYHLLYKSYMYLIQGLAYYRWDRGFNCFKKGIVKSMKK